MKLKHIISKPIFDLKTAIGRKFDSIIIVLVMLSILVVMLESVEAIRTKIGVILIVMEWGFTIFFTIEYIMRIKMAPNKRKYIFSFFGIIDLIAILPTYASLFLTGVGSPLIVRIVRLMRIFRALKLVIFLHEAELFIHAFKASWRKILMFLATSIIFAVIAGTLMFLIEGERNGFHSIPHSVYWAIVTLTTVGYGDISPHTPLGQTVASIIMILGYGIIAVPTGLVAAEIVYSRQQNKTRKCPHCKHQEHEGDANFCHMCGSSLPPITKQQYNPTKSAKKN